MPRQMLTDEYWSKLKPILLQQDIQDKPNLRMTMEGILYRMRTGCQWRDLPEALDLGIPSTSASTPGQRLET